MLECKGLNEYLNEYNRFSAQGAYLLFWDQYQYLSNGPPTPPLTHSIIEQDFYKTSKMEDKKNDEYSALCLHSI